MFNRWSRDAHLYLWLFISPFVLLFACSVLSESQAQADAADGATVRELHIPEDVGRHVAGSLILVCGFAACGAFLLGLVAW